MKKVSQETPGDYYLNYWEKPSRIRIELAVGFVKVSLLIPPQEGFQYRGHKDESHRERGLRPKVERNLWCHS
jgi:hypothetical protein